MIRALLGAVQAIREGRSSRWPAVRRAFLAGQPHCEACGGKAAEVHHVEPFHINPDRELDPANLMAVCGVCHLIFGHLKSWTSYNQAAREDAAAYRVKVRNRP